MKVLNVRFGEEIVIGATVIKLRDRTQNSVTVLVDASKEVKITHKKNEPQTVKLN